MRRDPIPLFPLPRKLHPHSQAHSTAANGRDNLDPHAVPPQGYRISITPNSCRIIAHDPAASSTPARRSPSFNRSTPPPSPASRSKIRPISPSAASCSTSAATKSPRCPHSSPSSIALPRWKINQLQLYIEHTFAYRGHEEVWQNASPLTADEIRAAGRLLQIAVHRLRPQSEQLRPHGALAASIPAICPWPKPPTAPKRRGDSAGKGRSASAPPIPRSLELLADLYSQLLPNFSSRLFNVGCDETFDIGQGRSKDAMRSASASTRSISISSIRVNRLVSDPQPADDVLGRHHPQRADADPAIASRMRSP